MATAKTTPTNTMETIQGTYLFRISGYSKTKGLGGVGKCIKSGTFNVGGCDWAILYYPDGCGQDCKDYVSVFVELKSKNTEVRAFYDLRLVDQTTGLSSSILREDKVPVEFKNPDSPVRGFAKFKKRSKLEASAYVQDDCLTIECALSVVKDTPRVFETTALSRICEVPPSDVAEDLRKLLQDEQHADVTFRVRGEYFAAHRVLLTMRSPVFEAELYGSMREKDTRCITIDDVQPTVFKAMLHYIYTDSLPTMVDDLHRNDRKEMICHLLVAADRYAIEGLKLTCEHILSKSLDVNTVATALALADQHHCEKLKEVCVEFMALCDRMDAVVASPGYQQLKSTCPSLLLDVLEKRSGICSTSKEDMEAREGCMSWLFLLTRVFCHN